MPGSKWEKAAIELSQKLKIEKVTGTIIIVKVLNRPAFEARNGSMGLADAKNLNREFPGKPGWYGDGAGGERKPVADLYTICTVEMIMKS